MNGNSEPTSEPVFGASSSGGRAAAGPAASKGLPRAAAARYRNSRLVLMGTDDLRRATNLTTEFVPEDCQAEGQCQQGRAANGWTGPLGRFPRPARPR